mmetsp:Transcript_13053/g.40211  ORF Transcript_13053/g.40211 Transcript_13053/m.40211 type:complete len:318 (+) Transcript_13053:142-1095(+)|eukprot:CAMPEP_0198732374 /NCGR_PEP_ID=MMETSP1475-20131203/35467_1 /TAXON_ID= ORGANISM="Unidentified sp., Strain CCMP1999" /NCGR_SAMPLE_ID=MMETSP1475 /ASSEMBLY_ACC=CAM_ASM_001111 /LENGTH=317 /DNA_ID=CAMNT_0044495467 /DNA_START=49 /DNA_END=1002 /DNA_ORIENTATION=+
MVSVRCALKDISNHERQMQDGDKLDAPAEAGSSAVVSLAPAEAGSGTMSFAARTQEDYLLCSEYADDIMRTLGENERLYSIFRDYFTHVQTDVTDNMRSILVDWLVEVCEEFKLNQETLHLAVNYLDRFLQVQPIRRSQVQLVGVSCLLLAAKFEEMYPPDVDELVHMTDHTYTRAELIRMESIIINSLHFRLTVATRLPFLQRLHILAPQEDLIEPLSHYLADLSLLNYKLLRCLPSFQSAACVYLARRALGNPGWDSALEKASGLRASDLHAPAAELLSQWRHSLSPASPLNAVNEKYSGSSYLAVSRILPPLML